MAATATTTTTTTKVSPIRDAEKLVRVIKAHSNDSALSSYELARTLEAFFGNQMHDSFGYEGNVEGFIEDVLEMTRYQVYTLRAMYRAFKRLKYTKAESIKMIESCGWSACGKKLPAVTRKITPLSFRRRLAADGAGTAFNILTTDAADAKKVSAVLQRCGMEENANGIRLGISEAGIEMARLADLAIKKGLG